AHLLVFGVQPRRGAGPSGYGRVNPACQCRRPMRMTSPDSSTPSHTESSPTPTLGLRPWNAPMRGNRRGPGATRFEGPTIEFEFGSIRRTWMHRCDGPRVGAWDVGRTPGAELERSHPAIHTNP